MGFTSIPQTLINVGKAITQTLLQYIKDDLDYLYGQLGSISSIDIQNGSFEIDSDSDGIPDTWTRGLYSGGSGAFETTSPAHGAKAYKFTHPGGAGNGGGWLRSDYIPCSPEAAVVLGFLHWCTAQTMKNIVYVEFYDKAKVYISGSDQNIYSSTYNPTSPMLFLKRFTPPANGRFMKIILIGGNTDTNVAGTAYFDGLFISHFGYVESRLRTFTFSQTGYGGTNSNLTDVASIMFPYGYLSEITAMQLIIGIELMIINGDGTTALGRYRIGSTYSTTFSQFSSNSNWVYGTVTMSLYAGNFKNLTGPATIVAQCATQWGDQTRGTVARKSSTASDMLNGLVIL